MKSIVAIAGALMLLGGSFYDGTSVTAGFSWTEGAAPPHACRYNVALSYRNTVVTVGGDNGGVVQQYDPASDHWSLLPPMPEQRSFAGAAVLDGLIYVVGGIDTAGRYMTSVIKYDPSTHQWSSCAAVAMPCSRLTLTAWNGKLFLFGGLEGADDRHYSNSTRVIAYDPKCDVWSARTSMPTARHGHSAVVLANRIFVTGGYDAQGPTGAHEVYDPLSNTWEKLTDMPVASGFHGSVTLDSAIYVIGGRVRMEAGPVSKYHVNRDAWIEMAPLPGSRNRFGLAAIGRQVFLVGGEDHASSLLIGELAMDN